MQIVFHGSSSQCQKLMVLFCLGFAPQVHASTPPRLLLPWHDAVTSLICTSLTWEIGSMWSLLGLPAAKSQ